MRLVSSSCSHSSARPHAAVAAADAPSRTRAGQGTQGRPAPAELAGPGPVAAAGGPRPGRGAGARPGRGAAKLRLRKNEVGPKRASIVFDKNWKNPFQLADHLPGLGEGGPEEVGARSSGRPGGPGPASAAPPARTSATAARAGCPNGTYSFVQHNRRKAPLINGRVFELQPQAVPATAPPASCCSSTPSRTGTTPSAGTRKGDDGCRWEVPVVQRLPVLRLHQDGPRRPGGT